MPYRADYESMPSEEIQRRVREQDLFSSTFLKAGPPAHDPFFTPMFTAMGFTGAITVGSATITTASLASFIAMTAISRGFQRIDR